MITRFIIQYETLIKYDTNDEKGTWKNYARLYAVFSNMFAQSSNATALKFCTDMIPTLFSFVTK